MKKPFETRTRWGTLARVFSARRNDIELSALIACLCVLFEDLRIEIAGIAAEDLGDVDECGKGNRGLYFLRRSIATLHEFQKALHDLDTLPAFQPIKARFDIGSQRHWADAMNYFKRYEDYIARIRHHVGGHFGRQAAKVAVEHLLSDSVGALEVFRSKKGGGAKLLFATELAGTGTLWHVPGKTTEARARRMIRHAVVGYRKAVWAVDCVTVYYLWERFGK